MHVAQSVQRLWDNDMHKTKLKEPRSKSDFERHSLSAFRSLRKSATHSRRDGAPGRPARSSSNRTIAICAALKPVWRMISSTPTGIGPSASSTSARSFSPGGGIADRPGASASGAPRGVRTPPSGASAPRTSAASVTSVAPLRPRPTRVPCRRQDDCGAENPAPAAASRTAFPKRRRRRARRCRHTGRHSRAGRGRRGRRPARQWCRSKDCPDARPCRCRA